MGRSLPPPGGSIFAGARAIEGEFARWLAGDATIRGPALSPDGGRLAAGSTDGTARVFDIATGHLVRRLEGFSSTLIDVVWSPDGRRLTVTGESPDDRIRDGDRREPCGETE